MKQKAIGVLIALVSVVLAGLVGEFRDRNSADTFAHVGLNETVTMTGAGQTFSVVGIRAGDTYRDMSASSSTTGRFIIAQIRVTTPGQQQISSLQCDVVTQHGSYSVLGVNLVIFPEPGASRLVEVAMEVPQDALVGVKLQCAERPTIRYRVTQVVVDLGITEESREKFLSDSEGRTMIVEDAVTEAIK